VSLRAVAGDGGEHDEAPVHRRADAVTPRDTDTADHARVLSQIVDVHEQMRAAEAELHRLQLARCSVLLVARQLDPPLPYKRIADAAGVTESAVLQVLRRVRG
jgi:hypothetical protein